MTLTLRPAHRHMKRRIEKLPTAKHNCQALGMWVRRPKVTGKLVCQICGKP